MAENAFAFWKEKDKSAQQEQRSTSPRPDTKSTTFPQNSTRSNETPQRTDIDPSELFRPLRSHTRATRPHSVVSRIRFNDPPTPRMEDEEDGQELPDTRPDVQSAPPVLDQQRPSRWRPRHQSVAVTSSNNSARSFVSYLDGPMAVRSASQSNISRVTTQLPSQLPSQFPKSIDEDPFITRSSPVVTRPTRARTSNSSSRVVFQLRTVLISHTEIEQQDFWVMVRSIMKDVTDKQLYLTSPTISRNTPQGKFRNLSIRTHSYAPSHVTLAVETGLVIKGGDTAVVVKCKAAGSVQEAIRDILAMTEHSSATLLYPNSDCSNFLLKTCGKDEYMDGERCLLDYEFIHRCIKLAIPAHVVLVERSLVKRLVSNINPLDLEMSLVLKSSQYLPQDELTSLYDSYISKDEDFRQQMKNPPLNYIKQYQHVTACVKLLCERAGFFEPLCLSEAIFNLKRACRVAMGRDSFSTSIALDMEVIEDGWSSINTTRLKEQQKDAVEDVTKSLDLLKKAVHSTVETYCLTMCTDYEPVWVCEAADPGFVDTELKLRVKVCALHRVPAQEFCQYHIFQVEMCVYYGGKPLCKKVYSPKAKLTRGFFPTIIWDKWMNSYIPLAHIPREARISFTLYGLLPPSTTREYKHIKEPLAWVSARLFSSRGHLISGLQLLGMWRSDSPADPLSTATNNIMSRKSVALEVYFEEYKYCYNLPDPLPSPSSTYSYRPTRPTPPQAIAKNMQDLASKDRFERLSEEDQRLVWAHRLSTPVLLSGQARGLPLILQVVPNFHTINLAVIHHILSQWPEVDPTFGLEILDSQYADSHVREKATDIVSHLSEDDFIDLLPQLVQSLKYDCYITSPMSKLLLSKVIASPRIAHFLYWNLIPIKTDPYFGWQYELLLSALQTVCGEEMAMELTQQSELVQGLTDVAVAVKNAKDPQKQTTLIHGLQSLSSTLSPVFRLPLDPSLQCCDIDIENCSFFNSKTVPLKLAFRNADPFGSNIEAIFKVGDDLRQDMLALQLIRLMDKIWLRAGLDLRLITYRVLSTGEDQGLVELVTDSSTLRQIQTEHGVTGSFKDKPLSEWLIRHNSSDSAWKAATDNFTHSCAGYCVATYVLGICDRHNDNIMVRKSGHMFHIDFGRILGNAQMFGSIKRDRVPFVLTPDMAYVINAGDKPSVRFQKFTDLCCSAFNELRKHSHLFLSVLSLLLSSNLPELSSVDDIMYVRDALLPNVTEEEATYHFTKNIEASLGTIATQINFFIHNLAQFKFSSPVATQGLLSFSPSSYSIATDGKVQMAVVVAYYMKYYPERYTAYQIQVTRCDTSKQTDLIFRRYSEFDELHEKLVECFPNEKNLPQLPRKKYLPGRSHTRETSEKRRETLNEYLSLLLEMDTSISESDVVYTFLHCLLRDEQDLRAMREEEQAAAEAVTGKVKLDLHYREDQQRLSIMVQHARELVPREGTDSIDPYVKLYLLPDRNKATKQKTKIARKTLNPTYNEMFHYALSPVDLKTRCLQLTVWDASSLLSKECLGCVLIELQHKYKELTRGWVTWFDLQPASLVNR